jgi:hypothetical protein
MMYESRHQPLLHRAKFLRRLLLHSAVAIALVVFSIGIGMLGYRHFEHLSWLDAFLNTSMLLGGMGPIQFPQTEGGKLFAGFFALYAGLVFIASAALLLAPVVHRLMHRFHLTSSSRDD